MPNTNFIVIFDRRYSSIELIHFLEQSRVQYLFRLSSNDYKRERELMITEDEAVKLMHTNPRVTKIKRNHLALFLISNNQLTFYLIKNVNSKY